MTSKHNMTEKFDNLNDVNLTTNLLTLQSLIKKWCELRPDNEELKQAREAILQITLLTNSLQLDRTNYHIAMSEYLSRSNNSIERARRAEDKVKELEKEISKLKKQKELGL
jgi:hypothetical protein